MDGAHLKYTAMQINHISKSFFSSWALTSYYDEDMEVFSSAIIRISVRSHNQGLLINHRVRILIIRQCFWSGMDMVPNCQPRI